MIHLLEKIQGYTHNGPSGNDKQVLPLIAGGAALLGAGASLYGGWKANQQLEAAPGPTSVEDIQGYMQPVQQQIGAMGQTAKQMQQGYGEMMGLGRQMMDPTSAMNRQQQQMMQQQGANQLALQSLLNRRQAAATGQDSGIMQAQQRQGAAGMSQSLRDQFQQQMMQNRQAGIGQMMGAQGLLGNVANVQSGMAGHQLGIQENIAQADIAGTQWEQNQAAQRAANTQAMWGGLGQGLMSFAGAGMGAHGQINQGLGS